jgi:hypothetical protein
MSDLSKQHQRYLDANGTPPGDCYRTSLACLLEIPRDEVPHFIHEYPDECTCSVSEKGCSEHDDTVSRRWWLESQAWVEKTKPGYVLRNYGVVFPFWVGGVMPDDALPNVILSGKSPRGDWLHSVIADCLTGEVVHDPHPAGGGVLSRVDLIAIVPKEYAS